MTDRTNETLERLVRETDKINENVEYSNNIGNEIYKRLGCLPIALLIGTIAMISTCRYAGKGYHEIQKLNENTQAAIERVERLEALETQRYNPELKINPILEVEEK